MRELIEQRLSEVEQRYGVRVLYACESGSRAWGFASPNSDWDVRFIYCHTPEWYLSINERRDVIELPIEGDLDINGWDLRKSLRLLHKGNPVLLEWLNSPIIYRQDQPCMQTYRALSEQFFRPATSFHHYLHMAYGNWREYLQGDLVRLKKYLYVLRPLLACTWIEQQRGAVVPMRFQELVDTLVTDAELSAAIADLLQRKQAADELGMMPQQPVLYEFCRNELARFRELSNQIPNHRPGMRELEAANQFFRATVLG